MEPVGSGGQTNPLIQSPILPVVTPFPLSSHHPMMTVFSILTRYCSYWGNANLDPPQWIWVKKRDPMGFTYAQVQVLVLPLGQVTIKLYKDSTVVQICQSIDPFVNFSDDEDHPEWCPDFSCGPVLCFDVVYIGGIWEKSDQKCWLARKCGEHENTVPITKVNELRKMKLLNPDPYKDKGTCPLLQYGSFVKMILSPGNLKGFPLSYKAAAFHRAQAVVFRNPRVGEGNINPQGFQAALEAYGPPQGSVEERVSWMEEGIIKNHDEYYVAVGEQPPWRNTPLPLSGPYYLRKGALKLSAYSTPPDVVYFVNKMLPKDWSIVDEKGVKYTSGRRQLVGYDVSNTEMINDWNQCRCAAHRHEDSSEDELE
uniref:Bet2 n=1 Tax=Simian foamy virus TaxID=11642 RepID=A0A6J3YTA7_9RETR|nr:Bet2 [Simian foamy virus]